MITIRHFVCEPAFPFNWSRKKKSSPFNSVLGRFNTFLLAIRSVKKWSTSHSSHELLTSFFPLQATTDHFFCRDITKDWAIPGLHGSQPSVLSSVQYPRCRLKKVFRELYRTRCLQFYNYSFYLCSTSNQKFSRKLQEGKTIAGLLAVRRDLFT